MKSLSGIIMNKILVLAFALIFVVNLTAQEKNEMENLQNIIHKVKSEFAPDKRVAIFHINIENEDDKYILKGETNLPDAKDKLIQKLKGFNISDQIKILPDAKLGDTTYGIVNLSVANLRVKPDHPEEMATQALMGTVIKIYKKEKGWCLVQTPDNYIAWTEDGGFVPVNHKGVKDWINTKKIIYTSDYGFSYSAPDEKSERVSDLVIGDILRYSGEEDGFCKVIYPDGKTAYIKSGDCKNFGEWLSQVNPTPENIVKTAKSFMGIPYLWGGTSDKGFDCSGFTKTVYFLNGIILPRDASQQVNTGSAIDTKNRLENLQPGDLLFFGKQASDTSKEKITHVAIYIGDSDYIHASGEVRINTFAKDKPNYNAYRDDSFVRAKRILNSIDKNGVISIVKSKYYSEGK